jgi:hypothetical protein
VCNAVRHLDDWKDGKMVLRWATVALLETEKHFHRIAGHKQLWVLKAFLDRPDQVKEPFDVAQGGEPVEPLAIDRKAG